jgi:hypothetical protein
MNDVVHVFAGCFADGDAARRYSEEHWESEPDESVSDEVYRAWEDRNPAWRLKEDLGIYLDGDFIETITDDDRYDYLNTMLTDPLALARIKATVNDAANTLVLIFSEAFGGFPASLRSTPRLTYCGSFACDLSRLS